MAKKIVAKTGIKHVVDGENYRVTAGETVDASKFTKPQLEQLYDAGAIELQETVEKHEEKEEAPVVEEPVSTPTKSAPTKAAASGKGNAA